MASSSKARQNKARKSSNASSSMDSETGRLLSVIGSPGSLMDLGMAHSNESSDSPFQIPAALSRNRQGSLDDPHIMSSLPPPPTMPSNFHRPQRKLSSASLNSSSRGSSSNRHLPERRLQPKKRKMSYESFDSAMGDSYLGLTPLDNSLLPKPHDLGSIGSAKESGGGASSDGAHGGAILAAGAAASSQLPPANADGISALDHLDALGYDSASASNSNQNISRPSKSLKKSPPATATTKTAPAATTTAAAAEKLGVASKRKESFSGEGDDNSDSSATFTSTGHRLLMEAIMMTSGGGLDSGGRKRLESWGGMSDLSVPTGADAGVNAAAAIAASALQHTGIIDDVTAAANFGGSSAGSSMMGVEDNFFFRPHSHSFSSQLHPPNLSLGGETSSHNNQHYHGRDRKESIASFSDSTLHLPASLDGSLDISNDLQKFVAAAVASVGDQLAELAGNLESAADVVDLDRIHKGEDDAEHSEVSSVATPLVIGASLDDPTRVGQHSAQYRQRQRQSSLDDAREETKLKAEEAAAAAAISVDYDAVAAAVDAAHAATGDLDLSTIGDVGISGVGGGKAPKVKRTLPTQRRKRSRGYSFFAADLEEGESGILHLLGEVPQSTLTEEEQEIIRERARRAAGYIPPPELDEHPDFCKTPDPMPPLKKRMKRFSPEVSIPAKPCPHVTPKISNKSSGPDKVSSGLATPAVAATGSSSKSAGKEKSSQKWDSMFDCLVMFREDRRKEETDGFTEEEAADWIWDGNVPTTYKTKDGKALGRWINNQRSAKSKGTLKEEREQRLVNAGLKWSVLASNSWNEMLDELRIYIEDYTKDGKKWDGNVPTNFRIKARTNGRKMTEEDKNLGRWVNRQRSLYQSGKLRKDRQAALEKVGLKWSMLATTSWDGMFETLEDYVRDRMKGTGRWDGNVPANYKTDDDPPRALGRWINRQRSAFMKKKLKKEYVDKLNLIGLKWSVHERGKFPEDTQSDAQHDEMPTIMESENHDSGAPCNVPSSAVPPTISNPTNAVNQEQQKTEQGAPPCQTTSMKVHVGPDLPVSQNSDELSPSSQATVKGGNQNTSNLKSDVPGRVMDVSASSHADPKEHASKAGDDNVAGDSKASDGTAQRNQPESSSKNANISSRADVDSEQAEPAEAKEKTVKVVAVESSNPADSNVQEHTPLAGEMQTMMKPGSADPASKNNLCIRDPSRVAELLKKDQDTACSGADSVQKSASNVCEIFESSSRRKGSEADKDSKCKSKEAKQADEKDTTNADEHTKCKSKDVKQAGEEDTTNTDEHKKHQRLAGQKNRSQADDKTGCGAVEPRSLVESTPHALADDRQKNLSDSTPSARSGSPPNSVDSSLVQNADKTEEATNTKMKVSLPDTVEKPLAQSTEETEDFARTTSDDLLPDTGEKPPAQSPDKAGESELVSLNALPPNSAKKPTTSCLNGAQENEAEVPATKDEAAAIAEEKPARTADDVTEGSGDLKKFNHPEGDKSSSASATCAGEETNCCGAEGKSQKNDSDHTSEEGCKSSRAGRNRRSPKRATTRNRSSPAKPKDKASTPDRRPTRRSTRAAVR